MTNSSNRKQLALAVSCALMLGVGAGAANAQTNIDKRGYVTDTRGDVVKSGAGLCWRTSSWTPALAIAECDPDLVPVATMARPVIAAPAAVVAAPQPAAERVTLAADTLFDYDKAVLRPAGRAALDDFVVKTKDINPEVILATGHADRFGSETYNQTLSERRAAAVKAYLLSKGVEANRVQTEGKGESQPMTKAGECLGAKSAKVLACLQPDRRVDVQIVGTRVAK
jgi:OOP family OmpA-OmpF porin